LSRGDLSGVAFARTPSAAGARTQEPARVRQSADRQWHLVAHPHWGAVARSAGEVRQVDDGLSALPMMERGRHLGSSHHDPCPGDGRQLPPQPGFDDGSRSCLGCRRKKGDSRTSFWPFAGRVHRKVHCLSDARGIPRLSDARGIRSSSTSRPAERRTRVSETISEKKL
jgi:hypothetical protein